MPQEIRPTADQPFVARAEELALLLAEIKGSTGGSAPAGAVVAGPAGVGKTRLVQEVSSRLDTTCVRVVGTRAARLIPYGAVAHLAPGLAARDYDDIMSWYGAISDAVVADPVDGERPVMIVDDAHLLDAGSAALVLHVAVTGTATVVATIRTGEDCPDPVTALWRDGLTRRIDLQPFSTSEAELLITGLLGGHVAKRAVHRLVGVCGGNALFLHEMVAAARTSGALSEIDGAWRWNGEVPHSSRLVDTVERRLSGLDDEARCALATIALGEPLAVDRVVRLAGSAALERIERLGLVTVTPSPDGGRCSCTHPLYGEVLVEQIGFFERRRLCGELADALAEIEPATDAGRLLLTRRRLEAGRDVAVEELTDAAVIAHDAFDFALAEQLARQALEKGGSPTAAVVLAGASLAMGDAVSAEDVLVDTEDSIFQNASMPVLQRYLDTRFRACYLTLGRRDAILEVLERFVERPSDRFNSDGRRDLVDVATAYRARVHLHERDLETVVAETAPIRTRVDAPPLARLHALQTTAEALAYLGRTTSARVVQAELRDLAGSGRREVVIGTVWADMNEVVCLTQEGRVDRAATIVEAAEKRVRLSPDAEARGLVSIALGAVRLGQGRPESARRSLLDALHDYRRFDPGSDRAWAWAMLAQAEAMLDRPVAARAAMDRSNAERGRLVGMRAALHLARGEACAVDAEGHREAAAQIMLDAAHSFTSVPMFRIRALHFAMMLGAAPDPLVEPLAELAAGTECEYPDLCVAHVQALADDDAGSLEATAERFAELGLLRLAAAVAGQAASRYVAQGLYAGADRTAARGRILAERCEGVVIAALAGLDQADALSRREREVARMAAQGFTNRQIAEELSVSVRTVESHLYRAFTKLGIDQRSELATVVGGVAAP